VNLFQKHYKTIYEKIVYIMFVQNQDSSPIKTYYSKQNLNTFLSLASVGNKEPHSSSLTPPLSPVGWGGESEGKGKTHGL